MAATQRSQDEMKRMCKDKMEKTKDPLERLRLACLSRGANGIKGLARQFKIIDDDGSRSLDMKEFSKGCSDFGVPLGKGEVQEIFDRIDKDQSGQLDFDEFLEALRPPMPQCRKDLIFKAFQKLDKTRDGVITVEDMKGVYNVKKHPKYLNGEKTEDELFVEFLNTFEKGSSEVDGKVTKEEFLNYYSSVSASIDLDSYFDLMMRTAYKL